MVDAKKNTVERVQEETEDVNMTTKNQRKKSACPFPALVLLLLAGNVVLTNNTITYAYFQVLFLILLSTS